MGQYRAGYIICLREGSTPGSAVLRRKHIKRPTIAGIFNPFPAKISYSNFHPLEVVSRYRDTQKKVGKNYS